MMMITDTCMQAKRGAVYTVYRGVHAGSMLHTHTCGAEKSPAWVRCHHGHCIHRHANLRDALHWVNVTVGNPYTGMQVEHMAILVDTSNRGAEHMALCSKHAQLGCTLYQSEHKHLPCSAAPSRYSLYKRLVANAAEQSLSSCYITYPAMAAHSMTYTAMAAHSKRRQPNEC